MRRLIGSLLLSFTVLMGGASAYAEDGVMNSVSFRKFPQDTKLQVQALDNSDSNLALQKEFERVLLAEGYTLSNNATLILTFETRDEIGAWTTTDRRHVLSFESKGGREGGENAKARLNVFNSQSGGLLNRGRSGTNIATPSSYRIDVSIEDRSTGKRFWQGWSIAKLGAADGQTLTTKMIPALVREIGKTVRQKSFEVY